MVLQNITDAFKRYWFLASSIALAVLYYFFSEQRKTLAAAHTQSQIDILSQKAKDIHEQLGQEGQDSEKARKNYEDLKRIHGDTLAKLGIVLHSDSK